VRRSLVALILLATAGSLLPAVASARGNPLKGQMIVNSRPVNQSTGSCSCVWPWYTFGLNPGSSTVSTTMRTYQHVIAGTWGLRLYVYRGSTLIGSNQVACWAKQKTCVRTISVTAKVSSPGVYYARIEGPGADGVAFTIQVRGHLYALHCGKTC